MKKKNLLSTSKVFKIFSFKSFCKNLYNQNQKYLSFSLMVCLQNIKKFPKIHYKYFQNKIKKICTDKKYPRFKISLTKLILTSFTVNFPANSQ